MHHDRISIPSSHPVLSILYQDEHFIAVNKPAGLLVHRTKMDRPETRFALQLLRDQLGDHVFPVHRLDKPTSGVLVFGRTQRDAAALSSSFEARNVEKRYLAIVRGYAAEQDRIVHPVSTERGKLEAITGYRRLATVELPHAVGRYETARYSLVLAMPETGRTHQLRRHFKHIFHPIIGDRKYGDDRHTRFFGARFGCERLLLHASGLRFRHPWSGEIIDIPAPLDAAFAGVVDALGWGGESSCTTGWSRIPQIETGFRSLDGDDFQDQSTGVTPSRRFDRSDSFATIGRAKAMAAVETARAMVCVGGNGVQG